MIRRWLWWDAPTGSFRWRDRRPEPCRCNACHPDADPDLAAVAREAERALVRGTG